VKFSGMLPYGRCKIGLWGLGRLGSHKLGSPGANRVSRTSNAAISGPIEATRNCRLVAGKIDQPRLSLYAHYEHREN
jgi:hypothetical protein